MGTKLSQFFQLEEFTKSDTADTLGIDNTPPASVVVNLTRLHDNVMKKIRIALGVPIYITSGYRCQKLNKEVGGKSNSQHTKGMACDFTVKGQSCEAIFNWIKKNCVFDQLILEQVNGAKWVHVSYNIDNNRRQSLKYNGEKYVQV